MIHGNRQGAGINSMSGHQLILHRSLTMTERGNNVKPMKFYDWIAILVNQSKIIFVVGVVVNVDFIQGNSDMKRIL